MCGTAKGLTVSLCGLVVCESHQGGFHAACVRALSSLRRPPLPAGHPATLDWLMGNMGQGSVTWRCAACIQEGQWGVSHLIKLAVTFGGTHCAQGSRPCALSCRQGRAGAALPVWLFASTWLRRYQRDPESRAVPWLMQSPTSPLTRRAGPARQALPSTHWAQEMCPPRAQPKSWPQYGTHSVV